ncbi:alpha/beta hydrolase [Pendulispora albinea]|uniref:Uncharacterized protein n=1 Tax=Pendulispora albinea TaxID=2741071 RepID=A0ABZ2LTP7_9BACT
MGSAGSVALAAPGKSAESDEPWCEAQTETLPDDVCYFDGGAGKSGAAGKSGQRRTLVVFLHGVIPPNTTWQWTQHRALVREAKQLGFAVLMPRAPRRSYGRKGELYSWPTAVAAQRVEEDGLVESWSRAQKLVESRDGRFDEVFVIGFSSGAYYASSLALRGRLDVDGYAFLAGGTSGRATATARKPIYVGVSARDKQTAPDARGLGGALTRWGWPHRVREEAVGHTVADVHMAHALGYLRSQPHADHAGIDRKNTD